jgi:hypothetical protein
MNWGTRLRGLRLSKESIDEADCGSSGEEDCIVGFSPVSIVVCIQWSRIEKDERANGIWR